LAQATGSDDFTIYLWEPSVSTKPIIRMTGHQQPINLVSFSPDGRLLASASFDKSLRIWNGQTGKYVAPQGKKRICSAAEAAAAINKWCVASDSFQHFVDMLELSTKCAGHPIAA
jgi:WD40 repeat protein